MDLNPSPFQNESFKCLDERSYNAGIS